MKIVNLLFTITLFFSLNIIISGQENYLKSGNHFLYNKILNKKSESNKIFSEKKSKVKGKLPFDQPDKFAQFHNEIRFNEKSGNKYSIDYKTVELKKAIERSSRLGKTNELNWIERGPGNVSGRTRGLIVDPDDTTSRTWYAGSVGGGVWRTTDAGLNWTNLTPELPNLATTVLAMAPSNTNVIYVGTGEGFYNVDAINGSGIFKTTDRGATWNLLQSTANDDFQNINRIIVDPNDENILLACANGGFYINSSVRTSGIYKSIDGGGSWKKVYSNISNDRVQQIVANPLNFNTLYATVNGVGVIKSTNKGESWKAVSTGLGSNIYRLEMAVSPVDTSYLYISAETETGSDFYLSENGGISWKVLNNSSGENTDWLNGQGWYDNTIAAHPYNKNIAYVGGIDLWRIDISGILTKTKTVTPVTDGYSQYGKPYIHVDHHNLIIIPKPNSQFWILNSNDGGVAVSNNSGNAWREALRGGYNTTQFYGIDKAPGSNRYIGGTQDNGTWISNFSEDPTKDSQYRRAWGGDGFEAVWNYADPQKILVSSQFNAIGLSTDAGNSFSSSIYGLTDAGADFSPFITRLASSQSDPDLVFAVGNSGVWRSDNFGATWDLIPITQNWSFNSSFTIVKISLADPQVVWAGNNVNSGAFMHLSTDGGINFVPTSKSPLAIGRLSGFATHPLEDETAFALFSFKGSPKILKTTDLGQTWNDLSGFANSSVSTNGFPDVAIYSLLVMPYNPNIIWAGTEIGLFESTDNGATWNYANNGLPAVAIWDMKIVDDQVVLGTHGRGIWSVTLPELTNYTPPEVTLSPKLNELVQTFSGNIEVTGLLRSVYDSTLVIVNENVYSKILNDEPSQFTEVIDPGSLDNLSIRLEAFKGDRIYKSGTKSISIIRYKPAEISYTTNFSNSDTDFNLNGLEINQPVNFSDLSLNSPHPYDNLRTYTATLLTPIIVSSENATLSFDEIALIEPGDPGSVFGEEEFWDYAVVEGSKDAVNWTPLEDGYDAKDNVLWLNVYTQDLAVTPNLKRTNTLNILDVFQPGDTIFIRFRLFADAYVTGWGWWIDNLNIQTDITDISDNINIVSDFRLFQNFPNPFNPSTKIKFEIPSSGNVTLKIFDMLGREVTSLLNKELNSGIYEVTWDAASFGSGVYFCKLDFDKRSLTRKLLLVK